MRNATVAQITGRIHWRENNGIEPNACVCTNLACRVVEEGSHGVERGRTDLSLVDRPTVLSKVMETLGGVSVRPPEEHRSGTEFATKGDSFILFSVLFFKAVVTYHQRSRIPNTMSLRAHFT